MMHRSRSFLLALLLAVTCVHAQPRAAVQQVERAVAAMNAKQYSEAERILRQVIKRYPTYYDARYELALVLSLQQRYDDALAECKIICDTAIPKEQQRDHYFQLLGNLYAQKDDSARADASYQLGLKRFPTSARLHVEQAIRLAQQGNLDDALEEIESAISGDPTYPLSYYWGARFYRASTERIWALMYAEIFINLRPNSARADEMSTLWYNMFREAIEQFDEEGRIVLSREIRASGPQGPHFPETFSAVLTEAARALAFNRDFEVPIASIDTLLRGFLQIWHARGYDTTFRNIIIDRYQQLDREGLLDAYIFVVAQHGKPMQFAEYAKQNKARLQRLERWIARHPLTLTRTQYLSRYRW
jgi:tetratricopeptide (TPR) repeat protein